VMLTSHPLLVPRLRKSRSCTSCHPDAPLWSVTGPLYLLPLLYSVGWFGDKWIMNWKGYERRRLSPSLRYYPGIFLERLRKTTKGLSGYPVLGERFEHETFRTRDVRDANHLNLTSCRGCHTLALQLTQIYSVRLSVTENTEKVSVVVENIWPASAC
jgi:hypothetical protein